MTAHNQHLPTVPQLLKATGIAVVAAGAILITTVLPSEFGIDPTGIGKAIGLTDLSANSADAAKMPDIAAAPAPVVEEQSETFARSTIPLRTDEMAVTLKPGEGGEVKSTIRKGGRFVFAWATDGGPVNFDMHGEEPNAGEAFTSYRKEKMVSSDQGSFVAPFDGTHGWYWRNRGDKPVTVKVKVSGFYEKLARVK